MSVEEGGTDRDADGCASMRWGRRLALVWSWKTGCCSYTSGSGPLSAGALCRVHPQVGPARGTPQSGSQRPRTQPLLPRCCVASAHLRVERPSHSGEMCVACQRLVRGESGDRPTVCNQRRMSIAFPHMPAAQTTATRPRGDLQRTGAPCAGPAQRTTPVGHGAGAQCGGSRGYPRRRDAGACAFVLVGSSVGRRVPDGGDSRRLVTYNLNGSINGNAVLLVLFESPAFTLHHKS